jgi:hypothetical protein
MEWNRNSPCHAFVPGCHLDHFRRSGQGLLTVSLVSGFHIINNAIYNTLTQAGVTVFMAPFTWPRNRV